MTTQIVSLISTAKKLSKFAQERAKQSNKASAEKAEPESSQPASKIIIGNIVERTEGASQLNVCEDALFDEAKGFPKPERIDQKVFFGRISFKFP